MQVGGAGFSLRQTKRGPVPRAKEKVACVKLDGTSSAFATNGTARLHGRVVSGVRGGLSEVARPTEYRCLKETGDNRGTRYNERAGEAWGRGGSWSASRR